MKTVKVTIVGGSNSVMQPGYLSAVLAQAEQRGTRFDVVANLAIGGTSSAAGLYRLKTTDAIEQSELLIIEYALNDSFIYGEERRQVRQWAKVYEGIIRHSLERNPNIIICSLIFGSRNGAFLASIPSVDAGIHYLSARYGTSVIDVSSILLERLGRHVVQDPKFYMDQGHYSRPIATAIVGDIVTARLLDLLSQGTRARGMPPSIDEGNFASAGVLTADDLARVAGKSLRQYKNRLFQEDAFDLSDMQLSFRLKGKLLALMYVCEPNGGMAMVQRGTRATSCALMKSGVQRGQFKFLTSMLNCDFLYGAQLLSDDEEEQYSISLHHGPGEVVDHVAKDNVRHDSLQDDAVVPLVGMLYSGILQDLRITPAPKFSTSTKFLETSTAA